MCKLVSRFPQCEWAIWRHLLSVVEYIRRPVDILNVFRYAAAAMRPVAVSTAATCHIVSAVCGVCRDTVDAYSAAAQQ